MGCTPMCNLISLPMTNFNSLSSPKQQLSQEQVLLAFPMVVAGLVALGLLLMWVLPQWRQRQVLVQSRDAILRKQEQLPQQRQALAAVQQQVQEEVNRQAQVLALIAPTRQLDTMLTALAEAAQAHNVHLVRYEPRQPVRSAPAAPASAAAAGDADAPENIGEAQETNANSPAGDPLLATGLKKQEILLTFEGSYGDILAVLQSLELLQPLAVAHDVKLEGRSPSADSPQAPRTVTTRMNLRLTVYTQEEEVSSAGDSTW